MNVEETIIKTQPKDNSFRPGVDNFLMLLEKIGKSEQKEDLTKIRSGILKLYEDLKTATGKLSCVDYFAGGGDGFPTLIAPNIYVVDRSPFWQGTQLRSIAEILQSNKSVLLSELEQNFPEEIKELKEGAQKSAAEQLHNSGQMGFGYQAGAFKETLPGFIGSLYIIGVNFSLISLSQSGDTFKISFPLGEEVHAITYLQQELPTSSDRKSNIVDIASEVERVRNRINELKPTEGKKGLLVKADLQGITGNFIGTDYDSIIYDDESRLPKGVQLQAEKEIVIPDYGIRWGYSRTVHCFNKSNS